MFKLILDGMKLNQGIQFLIFTNNSEKFEAYTNIQVIQYNKVDLIKELNAIFDLKINYPISSLEFGRDFICGLKPYIPIIFDKYFSDCEFYGWMDHEIILESNFDNNLKSFLRASDDIFSIGITRNSAQFQVYENNEIFKKYLYNNRYIYQNWRMCNNRENGKIRFFEEIDISKQDYLIGFNAIRSIFNQNKRSVSVNSIPNTLAIGNGFLRSKHPFSIKYQNGIFDKKSIEMHEKSIEATAYKETIQKSNVIWSLDEFYKSKNFDFDAKEYVFDFID
jgi:hypothetical protein